MTLDPRKSPAAFSALTAWGTLVLYGAAEWALAASGLVGGVPPPSTLWGTLGRLALDLGHAERRPGWLAAMLLLYGPTLALAGIVFAAGGALGRAYYWWRCERRRGRPGE